MKNLILTVGFSAIMGFCLQASAMDCESNLNSVIDFNSYVVSSEKSVDYYENRGDPKDADILMLHKSLIESNGNLVKSYKDLSADYCFGKTKEAFSIYKSGDSFSKNWSFGENTYTTSTFDIQKELKNTGKYYSVSCSYYATGGFTYGIRCFGSNNPSRACVDRVDLFANQARQLLKKGIDKDSIALDLSQDKYDVKVICRRGY